MVNHQLIEFKDPIFKSGAGVFITISAKAHELKWIIKNKENISE